MFKKIAENIVNNSLELKPGEKLNLIIRGESQQELGREIENYAIEKGIFVRTIYDDPSKLNTFTDKEFNEYLQTELSVMNWCDACAIVRDAEPIKLNEIGRKRDDEFFVKVHRDVRLNKRWNLTSVPARKNCKSDEEFNELYNTYIKACSIDYDNMSKAMDSLVARMQKADKVRIKANGTDITFSIKGLPPIKCIGKRNLPDGEVYTAPVRDSVNGVITYNMPSYQGGVLHNNIHFEFKDGKIVNESSDHTEVLTKILNTDEGSRYIGEFSFGVNPFITKCFNNTLYDEKISGTIHFTPGNAYARCDNGNKSAIHWDIVQSHKEEYGGGEIWFDDELIRKDGIFIPEYLRCLNPSQLISSISETKNNSQTKNVNLSNNKEI